ncbi:HTH-type transcriptional activator Btr [mine drainage metagenome]|uniref:HTH-type transcriptional activator Btr n=1 Tax=mine drainage metagenome TaxID=410659 RepID=A0A1J5RJD6_9ZZZZ
MAAPTHPEARSDAPPRRARRLLSAGVSSGSYFFIDLTPRATPGVRIAFGGREHCGGDYRVRRQSYPFASLEYVAEGRGEAAFGRGPALPLGPGTLFAYGPGVPHRIEAAPGPTMVKYFLCLSGRGAVERLRACTPAFGGTLQVENPAEIRDLFDLILREGHDHSSDARQACRLLVDFLLLKVGQAGRENRSRINRSRETFLRCKAWIDEKGASATALTDLLAALRIDRSTLTRLFRRYQGTSPYRYLTRRKMDGAALDFIRSGDLVKEVAARAGYPDPYHFSRVFKGVHGVSPARFRALYADDHRT